MAALRALPGLSWNGGNAEIDTTRYRGAALSALRSHLEGAPLRLAFDSQGSSSEVADDDVRAINRQADAHFVAQDVRVFQRFSANDQIMRRPLRFTTGALNKFAQDFTEGRGVHAQQSVSSFGHEGFAAIGRTLSADVQEQTVRGVTGSWLRTRFFVAVRDASAGRLQTVADLESGLLQFDSITALGGRWEFVDLDADDGEHNSSHFLIHDDLAAMPRLEAAELSVLSDLGAVYGAGSNVGSNVGS